MISVNKQQHDDEMEDETDDHPSSQASASVQFQHYFLATVFGAIFAMITVTLFPTISITSVDGKEPRRERLESSTVSCPDHQGGGGYEPSSSTKITKEKETGNRELSATNAQQPESINFNPDFTSCREQPRRCAVLYHAFHLSWKKPMKENNVPTFLWRAILSAISLKQNGFRDGNSGMRPTILLATNYPAAIFDRAKRILEKLLKQQSNCRKEAKRKMNPTLYFSSETSLEDLKNIFSLCNNGGGILTKSNPLPFDEIIFESSSFTMKADALLPSNTNLAERFDRVLYLDGDTFVNNPVWDLLDALPSSSSSSSTSENSNNLFDIGMAQEYNWHRDLAPFLYEPILYSSLLAPKDEHNTTLSTKIRLVPHHLPFHIKKGGPSRNRQKKEANPFGVKNHALYELQYNTGMIIYNPKSSGLQELVHLWKKLHRDSHRCKDDKVIWDQCSLPFAIRRSKRSRVLTVNDRFNFREALGFGCGAETDEELYMVLSTKKDLKTILKLPDEVRDEVKKRVNVNRLPKFENIVVFHSFEIKARQSEWIRKLFL